MFKIGDKAKGFKFEDGTGDVVYMRFMDKLEGIVGKVSSVHENSFVILFQEHGAWEYPASLWHLAKVEEDEPPKIGEKFHFKAGDRVKFAESSLASGMIDAKEGDVFTVKESYKRAITLEELEGCYHVTHFEHLQEEVVDNTEEQEIEWQVGQEVWCLIHGKGVVESVNLENAHHTIKVDFGDDSVYYTVDGRYYFDHNRTLFFSEPKIEAEKFPPKKPFTPTLKKGDLVVVKHKRLEDKAILTVEQEDEDVVWFKERDEGYLKPAWIFFKIGEEVEFK